MSEPPVVSKTRVPETVDIAIVGGGMVGLSLAVILAKGNPALRIAVIEAVHLADMAGDGGGELPPSFDARSSALAESSRQVFEQIGLWSALAPLTCAIETIQVSDRGHLGSTRLTAGEVGLPGLGYVVENRALGRELFAALRDCANVSLIAPARVAALRPLAEGMELRVGDQLCRAGLAVVADGANSTLLQGLGIHTHVKDYRQGALIANLALAEPHGGVAYERFTDEGPIALLPLPDAGGEHRAALVWTLAPERAEVLGQAADSDFLAELHRRFGFRAGTFRWLGSRSRYDLRLMVAAEQVRRHLVVAGNAAHFLHPVAGQGFNLALRDVARLAELVLAAVAAGQKPGELAVLEHYLAAQQRDQRNTILFSDSLPALFGQSATGAAALRNAGLIALDLLGPLRQQFARFGAGLLSPGVSLRG